MTTPNCEDCLFQGGLMDGITMLVNHHLDEVVIIRITLTPEDPTIPEPMQYQVYKRVDQGINMDIFLYSHSYTR